MKRIPITDEMRNHLRSEIERTGVGWEELHRALGEPSDNLTPLKIKLVTEGRLKSVYAADFQDLMDTLEKLPSIDPDLTSHRKKRRRSFANHIPITPDMRTRLTAELERTGVTLKVLAQLCSQDYETIKPIKITTWKNGHTKSADPKLWSRVMDKLVSLPDLSQVVVSGSRSKPVRVLKTPYQPWRQEYIDITPRMRRRLQQQFERTGIGPSKLLKIAEYPPPGLNTDLISAWKNGHTKSADPTLFNFTLNLLKSLPSKVGD